MRREIRVREPNREILIVRRFEVSEEEFESALPGSLTALMAPTWFSGRFGAEPIDRPRLVEFLRDLEPTGVGAVFQSSDRIQSRLVDAFRTGRLLAIGRPVEIGSGVGVVAPAEPVVLESPPVTAPEDEPRTFVEIELLDTKGRPVPSQRFKITLKGNVERTGSLDKNGFARVEFIDPGSVKVTFPDIDGREWKPA